MGKGKPQDIPAQILKVLGSMLSPRTPRGRVRQAFCLVLLLMFFAGNLSHAGWWNRAADWVHDRTGWQPPHFWEVPYRLGLDLQGGTHLVYVADVRDIPDGERTSAMDGVRDVIERRVNAFGVSEPLVQTNKSGQEWRVIVDLAGISDITEAIHLIGETPILEFKEENDQLARALTEEESEQLVTYNEAAEERAEAALAAALEPGADFAALAREHSEDEISREAGGELGFVRQTDQFGELAIFAEDLEPDPERVVGELVTTSLGFHVLRYDERHEGDKEVQAEHILICYAGAERCEQERTKEEARQLAQELREQATVHNFVELAKANSDDQGSADSGGDLGWFGRGTMVTAFEEAVFALADGQISDPVETDFGFHLIHKRAERPIYEYKLSHIFVATMSPADILPPLDEWKNTELSGKHLKRSSLQFNPQTGEPTVGLEFNAEGKDLFADITTRNVGKPVAIFLDGYPLSVPTVQEAIREGEAVITGRFTITEAKQLVQRLNAGALPVPINLESQQSVGATLGRDSLDSSLKAGLIGFLIVVLFMLLYYRVPGLIALLALSLYTAINLALYKLIPVTLTLSGIAGFILSVGMAVDANILIFERLKEELIRGRTLGSALDEGFKRAWLSIRDSNFTTLISCIILFYTSSSLIKGFALTLGIGVLVSMFSAITVSRTLLRLVSGWRWLANSRLYLPVSVRPSALETDEDES